MENIKSDGLNATEDKREEIKQKLRQYYDGRIGSEGFNEIHPRRC